MLISEMQLRRLIRRELMIESRHRLMEGEGWWSSVKKKVGSWFGDEEEGEAQQGKSGQAQSVVSEWVSSKELTGEVLATLTSFNRLSEYFWGPDRDASGKSKSLKKQLEKLGGIENLRKLRAARTKKFNQLLPRKKRASIQDINDEAASGPHVGYHFGSADDDAKKTYQLPDGLKMVLTLIKPHVSVLRSNGSGLLRKAESTGLKSADMQQQLIKIVSSNRYANFIDSLNSFEYAFLSDAVLAGLEDTFVLFFKLCALNQINLGKTECPIIDLNDVFTRTTINIRDASEKLHKSTESDDEESPRSSRRRRRSDD